MDSFTGENFMPANDTAVELYLRHTSAVPVIDARCHPDPKTVSGNRRFSNITEVRPGADIESGRLPRSEKAFIGQIIEDICPRNAEYYFGFGANGGPESGRWNPVQNIRTE